METNDLATQRAREAINNIIMTDPKYWQQVLESRLVNGSGSKTYYTTVQELSLALLVADWEEYTHEAISVGCTAFITEQISGKNGVLPIEDDDIVRLIDPKNTGKVSAEFTKPDSKQYQAISPVHVGYSVLICGMEDGKLVAFTFHPGPPIKVSEVPAEGNIGQTMSGRQAKELGLMYGKL